MSNDKNAAPRQPAAPRDAAYAIANGQGLAVLRNPVGQVLVVVVQTFPTIGNCTSTTGPADRSVSISAAGLRKYAWLVKSARIIDSLHLQPAAPTVSCFPSAHALYDVGGVNMPRRVPRAGCWNVPSGKLPSRRNFTDVAVKTDADLDCMRMIAAVCSRNESGI